MAVQAQHGMTFRYAAADPQILKLSRSAHFKLTQRLSVTLGLEVPIRFHLSIYLPERFNVRKDSNFQIYW